MNYKIKNGGNKMETRLEELIKSENMNLKDIEKAIDITIKAMNFLIEDSTLSKNHEKGLKNAELHLRYLLGICIGIRKEI